MEQKRHIAWKDKSIASLKPGPKRYIAWDRGGSGLGVRVSPQGRKVAIFMYRFGGKARMMTLGTLGPSFTLADANRAHADALKKLEKNEDPATQVVAERRAYREAETVKDLATQYIESWAKLRKRSWREDERILNHDVLPAWGKRKAVDITRRDVIALLDRIVERGSPIAANRTLACIRKMFNWALSRDLLTSTPCFRVAAPSVENQRDRVLSEGEIRTVWRGLEDGGMAPATRLALKFMLLTAQRKGEIVGAEWPEIDGNWWTIPAAKSKNKLPHRVPLSLQALALLEEIKAQAKSSRYLFPSTLRRGRAAGEDGLRSTVERGDRPITGEAVGHAVRRELATEVRIGRKIRQGVFAGMEPWTPHDLRRSAASQMTGAGVPRLVVKKILNHAERDITAVYDRHSYDAEKRQALEMWGRKLETIVTQKKAPVVALNRQA